MHLTQPLTDEQLRAADAATRDRYLRILTLVTQHRAPWHIASAAVEDADMQPDTHDAGSLSSI